MRQNTERRDIGSVPDDSAAPIDAIAVPKPPVGLLPSTLDSWERYFRSVARHVTVVSLDLDLLERLWTLYDERERARQELRRPIREPSTVDEAGKVVRGALIRRDSRMIEGSKGQMRPNGLYNVIARLDAEIRQLEDRLPKSVKARLILGMVVGDDDRSDKPDAASGGPSPDDHRDDDGPSEDPRLYALDGGRR